MKQIYFLFLLILFLPFYLTAQVKIEERVVIEPKQKRFIEINKATTTETYQLKFTASCGAPKFVISIYYYLAGHIISSELAPGDKELSLDVRARQKFICRITPYGNQDDTGPWDYTCKFYLNNKYWAEASEGFSGSVSGMSQRLIRIPSELPNDCEDAPECELSPETPRFIVDWYENGQDGNFACPNDQTTTGIFSPHFINLQNITIEPCYDLDQDKWKFNINNENIPVYAILDICESTIAQKGWKLIEDVTDITTVYNDSDPCDALADFEGHRTYPQEIKEGGYYIKAVALMHEHEHRRDFESYFDKEKHKLDSKLQEYYKSCSEMSSEQANSIAIGNLKTLLYTHFEKIYEKYENYVNNYEEENENKIHYSDYVQNTINYYISSLKSVYDCN